ncbi:hypothetical protein ABZX39_37165 [Streptomyces collinus]|uniref:hypothetical protein n=1 Tax=Streptomyces collinus TaxID=42684 RepID=UPI00339FC42D
MSIDRIAIITGTDPARVTALLAAAHRPPLPSTGWTQNRALRPQELRTACPNA